MKYKISLRTKSGDTIERFIDHEVSEDLPQGKSWLIFAANKFHKGFLTIRTDEIIYLNVVKVSDEE